MCVTDSAHAQGEASLGLFNAKGVFRLALDVRDSELDQFGEQWKSVSFSAESFKSNSIAYHGHG
jgi:hypothetical protein